MIQILMLIIGVIVAIVAVDALRHRVLFKMGFRNIFRKKTETVIVILGLMVATAIISSSFGVGDTMENMVESEILDDWQQTDVTLYNTTEQGNYIPFSYETYLQLKTDILRIDNVEDVVGEVHGRVSIFNIDSMLSSSDTRMIGMDLEESDAFGDFWRDGERFSPSLDEGEIFIDERLASDIDAEVGQGLMVFSTGHPMGREYTVKEIIEHSGRPAFHGPGKIVMNLEDARSAMDITDQMNFVRVTSIGGVRSGAEYSDGIFSDIEEMLEDEPDYHMIEVRNSKNQMVEDFKEMMSVFTDLFFIFGSFVIIAAIILTINIFVMLGEERKSEMGMSRAIGMKRSQLRRVFSYEGIFYAGGASAIGAFTGVGIAYIIFYFLEDVFASMEGDMSLLQYFHFSQESLLLAFGIGFLLTMATILFSVTRISKLNIVRAIREIPDPPVSKKSKKIFYLAIAGLAIGVLLTLAGVGSGQLWLPATGLSLIIIGLGTVSRRWVGDRVAYTAVGIFLLIWWLAPLEMLGFWDDYSAGLEMFILSGVFTVTAGIMVIMLNGSIITGGMEKLAGSGKGAKAMVLSAVSHPLKEKFRTGMTMFIFALIIFAIIVMSMIVGIFDVNIDRMIEDQSGGYHIVGLSAMDRPIDNLYQEIINSDLDVGDFGQVDSASAGMAYSVQNDELMMRSIIGVDRNFARNNTFGFTDHMDEFGSEDELWEAVMSDPSLVLTNDPGDFGPPGDRLEVGSTITFIDRNGEQVEKKVAGLMDQFIVQGFFMSRDAASSEFDITANQIYFVELNEGVDADQMGRDMEREFIRYGFQPMVIDTIFREVMSAQFMFFNLFSGYMGLGLVVGIAGLGIISLRAVHERRLEIGMMRAIGFKRRMIKYVFLIENSFVTITGIILGSLLGIGVGWLLWYDGFKPMGWEFYIPWSTIIVIAFIAYFAMLLTAIPSAHKASKVSPAEALRFD